MDEAICKLESKATAAEERLRALESSRLEDMHVLLGSQYCILLTWLMHQTVGLSL